MYESFFSSKLCLPVWKILVATFFVSVISHEFEDIRLGFLEMGSFIASKDYVLLLDESLRDIVICL